MWVNGILIERYENCNTVMDGVTGDIEMREMKINGTLGQPLDEIPPHVRQYDALIFTDDWQDIVDGGYLTDPEGEELIFIKRASGPFSGTIQ